ncbi:MAG: esterase [Gemmatimonadota bacterium]
MSSPAPGPGAAASVREEHIRVARTARFAVVGADAPGAAELWIACHGYRQLARNFARSFVDVASASRRIIVPEGLSRFYVDDDGGPHGAEARVGATWMTREDRESEIDDYVEYLDALAELVGADDTGPGRLTAFGFSQGAATASRWAAYGRTEIDRLILWAGLPAHDLDLDAAATRLAHVDVILAYGTDDAHVTRAAADAAAASLHEAGVPARTWPFEGGHRVAAARVADLARELTAPA